MNENVNQETRELITMKLVEDVEGTLKQATEQSSHSKKQALSTLFHDLSNKIKKKYQTILKENVNMNYYFEILADYYYNHPKQGENIEILFKDLISNHFYPSIFSLLFYKLLFKDGNPSLNKLNIFLKGVNRLFWSDIENKTFIYRQIFYFLKNLFKENSKISEDLISLIFKYYFYYHKSLKLFNNYIQFITSHQKEEPDTIMEVFLYEIFIRETIIMLESINDEEILLKLIQNLKFLNMEVIDSNSKLKLQDILYILTRPGPPHYPTRSIRHESNETLDILFPKGKIARFFLGATFRIFHNLTWPTSMFLYFVEKIWGIITYPYHFFYKLFNPDLFSLDIEFDIEDIDIEHTESAESSSDEEK